MRFRLTFRSTTLDDLELYKLEFSDNFSDTVVSTSNWSNFLACSFRVARVCQQQLDFLVLKHNVD